MSGKALYPAFTNDQRDAVFGWFQTHGVEIIDRRASPAVVADEITRDLGFPCSVAQLDQFRRLIAVTFASTSVPTTGERLTVFNGLVAVLCLLLHVFTEGGLFDPFGVDLGKEVKE